MSHFNRPMHLFSRYVSAREEIRFVHSTSSPFLLHLFLFLFALFFIHLSSFAFKFIFNRTTHHGTRVTQLTLPRYSPVYLCLFLLFFLFLLSHFGHILLLLHSSSFFFPFATIRFLFLFSSLVFLSPLRLRSFSLCQRRTEQPGRRRRR